VPGLVPAAVFVEALVGRRLLAPGDGYSYYLGLRAVTNGLWRSGVLPAWDPWAFGGSPLLSLQQAAVLYPPNLATVMLPMVVGHNLVVVGSFSLAASGTYLLARRLNADRAGAAVAGLAFGLSGFLFGHIVHTSVVATAAWLPWLLWGFDLVRERLTPPRLLAAGGSLAMAALAGHGQMVAFSLALLLVYVGTLVLLDGDGRRRHLLVATLMTSTGLGLAAVQLLPVLSVLGHTDRASLTYEQATAFSFSPVSTLLLVFPYLFGNQAPAGPFSILYRGEWSLTELSGYVGAAALVLAGAGLRWSALRGDRRLVALSMLGVTSLIVALGDSTPVGRIVHALPIYGQFRSWGRFSVGVDLAVAVLAGRGVTELLAVAAPVRKAAARRAAVVAFAVVALASVTPLLPGVATAIVPPRQAILALGLPASAALLAAGVAVAARRRRLAILAVVPVVALDLVSFGLFFRWREQSPTPTELSHLLSPDRPPSWGTVPDAPGGVDRVLYASSDPLQLAPWYQRVPDAKRIRFANGFDPLAPQAYLEAVGRMDYRGGVRSPERVWSPDSHVLDLLRVSVVVVHPRSTRGALPSELGPGRAVPGTAFVRYERRPRLPDAFLVGAVRPAAHEDALHALWGQLPHDPSATALVEGGCSACATIDRPGKAGVVTNRRWGVNTAGFEVTADRPALLVVSQAWFPGWSASVDGERAPVVRVDGLVQGVPVPPGAHTVTLRYRPPGLVVGGVLSAATLSSILAWAVFRR
jgi:hypothetical protein